jgi:DNA-binding NarL/FixJ family response regulator
MRPINVVIIENENISRVGAATILSETGKIQVCGLAKTGKEGIEIVDQQKPDIVVINIDLPDINGTDVISLIKCKHTSIKIVVMTANSSRVTINAAISNGADCYYCKNNAREEVGERFIEAVMAAYNNESWIDPTINRILIDNLRSNDTADRDSLDLLSDFSNKEITVLKLAAGGMKNNEIANVMYVSEGTVRSYLHNSFIKLGVKDRLNAIREAIRLGILSFADMKIEEEVTQAIHTKVKTNQNGQKDTAKTSNKGYKGWVA